MLQKINCEILTLLHYKTLYNINRQKWGKKYTNRGLWWRAYGRSRTSQLHQFSKFNCVYGFLGKILPNFVCPNLKLHNLFAIKDKQNKVCLAIEMCITPQIERETSSLQKSKCKKLCPSKMEIVNLICALGFLINPIFACHASTPLTEGTVFCYQNWSYLWANFFHTWNPTHSEILYFFPSWIFFSKFPIWYIF